LEEENIKKKALLKERMHSRIDADKKKIVIEFQPEKGVEENEKFVKEYLKNHPEFELVKKTTSEKEEKPSEKKNKEDSER